MGFVLRVQRALESDVGVSENLGYLRVPLRVTVRVPLKGSITV